MHSHFFTLATLLVGGAVAAENWASINYDISALKVRQGASSFIPGQTSGQGETCAEAFGPNYVQCGTDNDCYDPTAKESCCSEGYPCPADSFCLTAGYCCPDGMDPATCAKEHGVTLPASTGYSSSTAYSSASSSEAPVTTTYATSVGTVTVCPTSKPCPSLSTTKAGNGTVTLSPTNPPPFTGAGSPQNVVGGAAALLGFLGLLQNLL